MREILFRGKRKDNGEWVEGGIIPFKIPVIIKTVYDEDAFSFPKIHIFRFDVIPETVGQYTGLTDKNGKKIFEGDIVKTDKFNTPNKLYVIKYDLLLGAFIGEDNGTMYFTTFDGDSELFEIIGNTHDNPELLKGGELL